MEFRRQGTPLSSVELAAARLLIARVLEEVGATLVEAALFGSKARGAARPDSDVDVLLVFARLPPSREPFAGQAERIAEQVARETGVPVTVWSVALSDLRKGHRTPMLVDALEDSVPLWCLDRPLPSVEFTPDDAVRCAEALLDRVAEGSAAFANFLERGDTAKAALRAREDVVRLCTALLLLRGSTRPRRSHVVELILDEEPEQYFPILRPVLEWASNSYGPDGRDEDRPVSPPDVPPAGVAAAIDYLRCRVEDRICELTSARGRRG